MSDKQPEFIPVPLFNGDANEPASLSHVEFFQKAVAQLDFDWEPEYRVACQMLDGLAIKTNTFRTYLRDLDRFFLWRWFVCGQSCLTMRNDEMTKFIQFIDTPPVSWQGGISRSRLIKTKLLKEAGGPVVIEGPNTDWRPFVMARRKGSGLAKTSKVAMFGGLSSFYQASIYAELVGSNPVLMSRKRNLGAVNKLSKFKERTMSDEQLEAIFEASGQLSGYRGARARYLVSLLYYLGVRVSELCDKVTSSGVIRCSSSRFVCLPEGWCFHIEEGAGKGDKDRYIPVAPALLEEVKRFRSTLSVELGRQLTSLPSQAERLPLVPHSYRDAMEREGLDANSMRNEIKMVLKNAAALMREEAAEMEASGHHEKAENLIREADGLSAISPHWFRHKYATDDIEDGGNISHTQANLGHSSLSTTSIYVHADMTKRVETSAKKRKLS